MQLNSYYREKEGTANSDRSRERKGKEEEKKERKKVECISMHEQEHITMVDGTCRRNTYFINAEKIEKTKTKRSSS